MIRLGTCAGLLVQLQVQEELRILPLLRHRPATWFSSGLWHGPIPLSENINTPRPRGKIIFALKVFRVSAASHLVRVGPA